MPPRPPARPCPFCAIVAGRAPAQIIRRWHDSLALVPLHPVTPGHILVIPTQHVPDALTDPGASALVMRHACELAADQDEACNIITSVGAVATQTVRHLHLHLVPRRVGDGLHLPWTGQRT